MKTIVRSRQIKR